MSLMTIPLPRFVRWSVRAFVGLVVIIVATAALLEVGVRLALERPEDLHPANPEHALIIYVQGHAGRYPMRLHEQSFTRGWATKPNLDAGIDFTVTTNNRGMRASPDYDPKDPRPRVMLLGDSFTWGDDLNDQEIWPYILQQRMPEVHFLNFGVSGYGVDQMYITLLEEIETYQPTLVVLGFIGEDLFRCNQQALGIWPKPWFTYSPEEGLVHHLAAWGDEPAFYRAMRRRYGFFSSHTLLHLRDLRFRERHRAHDWAKQTFELNTQIIRAAEQTAKDNRARFLLLAFPGFFPNNPDAAPTSSWFLKTYAAEHDTPSHDLWPGFVEAGVEPWRGHWPPEYNVLAADIIQPLVEDMLQPAPATH